MKYVKCSFCGCLNWVAIEFEQEDECLCDIHKQGIELFPNKHDAKPRYNFAQEFTFENVPYKYRGFSGYKAYNRGGEFVGIVFSTTNKGVSFGYCELAFFERYWETFGQYHRITSYGQRVPFAVVEAYLREHEKYICFVD